MNVEDYSSSKHVFVNTPGVIDRHQLVLTSMSRDHSLSQKPMKAFVLQTRQVSTLGASINKILPLPKMFPIFCSGRKPRHSRGQFQVTTGPRDKQHPVNL